MGQGGPHLTVQLVSGALGIAVLAAASGAAALVGSPADLLSRLSRAADGGRGAGPEGSAAGRRSHRPGAPPRRGPRREGLDSPVLRRRVALGALMVAVSLLTGSVVVAIGSLIGAVVADRLLARLEPAASRARTDGIVAALPAFADLVAATVRAGIPPERALRVCSTAVGGPLGKEVGRVVTALELGLAPERAWTGAGAVRGLEPLARAMVRGQTRGSSPVAVLERCSLDARRIARSAAQGRAQAVGVAASAPLGLCFLPAFVLVSVVPTVVGGLSSLLG